MLETMNRIARFFDAEYEDYMEDLPALQAYAQRTGGPLLELGCGTGRLLVPLARAGYAVTGVDLSAEMLRRARAKLAAANLSERVTLIEGDYATAALGGPYRFAFCVMNTFLHLLTTDAQVRALRHWRQHLVPGGLLLLDIFHPDFRQLAELDGRLIHDRTWRDPETGATVMKFVTCTADPARQLLHVTMLYDEIAADGEFRRTVAPYDIRYMGRAEAELVLERAGYALEAVYGGWDLAPFEGNPDRMILVAQRAR
ncbi:MAG: methyltransferase domain-containing protein [Anaerolineae bacterium]|nr:methyltransferase domain-containing protein [Anaerolineae bacterium]